MGILSRLFGGSKSSFREQDSSGQHGAQAGGKLHPYVIRPPAGIGELRQGYRERLQEARKQGAKIPELNNEQLDQMIAEQIKMAFLRDCFGTEGKHWEAGERAYLPQSIQTQLIHFKDGRPSMVFYTDFSQFGGFPSEQEAKPKQIFIDEETADSQWVLCRGPQRLVTDGLLLTAIFMSAQYKGWKAADLFSWDGRETVCVLKPMLDIYKEDALKLAQILEHALENPASAEDLASADFMQVYIDFFYGGGFHLEPA